MASAARSTIGSHFPDEPEPLAADRPVDEPDHVLPTARQGVVQLVNVDGLLTRSVEKELQILHYGDNSLQVLARLTAMLRDLGPVAPPERLSLDQPEALVVQWEGN